MRRFLTGDRYLSVGAHQKLLLCAIGLEPLQAERFLCDAERIFRAMTNSMRATAVEARQILRFRHEPSDAGEAL